MMTLYKATLVKSPIDEPDMEVYVHVVSENMWDARDLVIEQVNSSSNLRFKLIHPVSSEGSRFIIDTGLRSDLARK